MLGRIGGTSRLAACRWGCLLLATAAFGCRAELPAEETVAADAATETAMVDAVDADAGTDTAAVDAVDADAATDTAGVDAVDAVDADAATDAAAVDAVDADAATDAAGVDAVDADADADTAAVDAVGADAATDAAAVDAVGADAATDAAAVDAVDADAATDAAAVDAVGADAATDAAGVDAVDADAATDAAGVDAVDADAAADAAAVDAVDADANQGTDAAVPPKCTATSCDDGKPCTQDSCDPLFGCKNEPKSGSCDDGDACTANDQCAAGNCSGAAKNCADGNTCTADSCDKSAGCQNKPAAGPCDDGDACSLGDLCAIGSCVAGAAKTCDDGSPCSQDSCAKGACVFKPVPCQAPPCLADGDCPSGKCDTKRHMCVVCLAHGDCGKDAPVCAGGWCQPGALCKTAVDCKASSQVCDLAAGACADCLADGDCGSGQACHSKKCVTKQPCSSDKQCVTAEQPICVNGACVSCGAAAPCPVGETCDTAGTCQPNQCDGFACSATHGAFACENGNSYAAPKTCADGNPCTGDDCSAKNGCANPPKPDGSSCQIDGTCPLSGCKAGQCTSMPLAGEATFTLGPVESPGSVFAAFPGASGGVIGLASVQSKIGAPSDPWLFALSQGGKLLWKKALPEPSGATWTRGASDGNGGVWAVSGAGNSPSEIKLWHYDSGGVKVGGFDLTGHLDGTTALAGDATRAWVGGHKTGARQLGHLSSAGQWSVAAYPAPPNSVASDLRSLALHPNGLVIASGHSQNSASYNYLELRGLDNLQTVLASKAESESGHSNTQLFVVGTQVVERVLVPSGGTTEVHLRRFDANLSLLGSVALPAMAADWRVVGAGQLGIVAHTPGNYTQGITSAAHVVAYDINGKLVWSKAIGSYYDGVLSVMTVSGAAPILLGTRAWPNPSIRAVRLTVDGEASCPCVVDGKPVGTCDDQDPCTLDSCGAKGCAHAPAANGSACDDGHPYTPSSVCQTGKCTAPCSQLQLGSKPAESWTVSVDASGNARALARHAGQFVAYKLDAAGKESSGAPFSGPPNTGVPFDDGSWLIGGYVSNSNSHSIVPVAPDLKAGPVTNGFNNLSCNSVSPVCTATPGLYALYCLSWETGILKAQLPDGGVAWDAGPLVVPKTGNLASRIAHTGTCGDVILCADAEVLGGQVGDVVVRKLEKGTEKWKTTVPLGKVTGWSCATTTVPGSALLSAYVNVNGSTVWTRRLVQSNGVTWTRTDNYPNVSNQVSRLWSDGAGTLGGVGHAYPKGWGLSQPVVAAFAFDAAGEIKSTATLAQSQPYVLPGLSEVRYVSGDVVVAGTLAYNPGGLAGQSLARWTFPKMAAPACQ